MKRETPHKLRLGVMRKFPLPVVDGILLENGRICLVKRAGTPFRGSWVLPGGFVENGETLETAAVREFFEETGLRTKVTGLAGVHDDPKRDPRGHAISMAFFLKRAGGSLRTSSETSDVRFFPVGRIPRNVGFDHRRIIKDALKVYRRRRGK
jgi:ADP-ribose pyrophosphatase YjhB (NUDIX family)